MTSEEAWKQLVDRLGVRDAMILIEPLREQWKNQINNVSVSNYEKGKPQSYKSDLEGFPSWGFGNELEANLANALFLIAKSSGKKHREEKMRAVFQMALTLLDVESDWRF